MALGLLLALAPAGHAVAGVADPLTIDIVSPGLGCFNNGGGVFRGGVAGGEAVEPLIDVPLVIDLFSAPGDPITLSFFVDGQPLFQGIHEPQGLNEQIQTDLYVIPADLIADGEAVTIRILAEDGTNVWEDSVTFRLDRTAPDLIFDVDQLEALQGCLAQPPQLDTQVVDAQDANATLDVQVIEDGCSVTTQYLVADDCGNQAEIVLITQKAPAPNQINVALTGYRCGLDECITEGPDAATFPDAARVGRGTATFAIEAPNGCVDSVEATISRNGAEATTFVPGQPIEAAGNYRVAVAVGSCGQEESSSQIDFTVLDRPTACIDDPGPAQQGAALDLTAECSSVAPELGGIVEYAWDLDDDGFYDLVGTPQEAASTSLDTTALGNGTHTVWLRITAGNGGIDFVSRQIEVNDVSPTCVLADAPVGVLEGQPVNFDASASVAGHPTEPITSFEWDFGDNLFPQNGAGLTNPAHMFNDSGAFTVRLTVNDIDSSTSCDVVVNVGEIDPNLDEAGIGALNAAGLVEGTPVSFTVGETAPGSGADPLTNFTWTFGVGQQGQQGEFLRNPTHVYPDSGQFEVCLVVDDEDSQSDPFCFEITVADLEPIAALTGPLFGSEGEEVVFDACDSIAGGPDDVLDRLVWTIPAQGGQTEEIVTDDPTDCTLRLVLPTNGALSVSVDVWDEDGSVRATHVITVSDATPTAALSIDFGEGNQAAREGQAITLSAAGSTAGAETDPIAAYRWEFGDGTDSVQTDTPTVLHAWPNDGIFEARLTVIDSDGSEASATTAIEVLNISPVVHIQADPEAEIGVPITFRLVVDEEVDADLPLPVVFWCFGDRPCVSRLADVTLTPGENSGVEVTHTYDRLAEFRVRAFVDDNPNGDSLVEAETRVEVTPAAPRIAQFELEDIREGQVLEFSVTIDAAQRERDDAGEIQYDGPVQLAVPSLPSGATFIIENEGEARQQTIRFTWTPTFFDAGQHRFRVTALAPFAGLVRGRDFIVNVLEAGSPVMAGAGGTARRGVVTFFAFGKDGDRVTFMPQRQVEIGLGAGGLAHSPSGDRLFVASPGSGTVAVVSTTGEQALLRSIPTGNGTSAVIWGGETLWALNTGDNSLSVIDPATLKVMQTIDLAPLEGPIDLAWLPAGFDGLREAKIAVVTARSGEVALIDPDDALAGRDGLDTSIRLGGVLNRIAVLDDTLYVSDGKTHVVYALSPSALLAGDEAINDTIRLDFAARDMLAASGSLWMATEGGLQQLDAEGNRLSHASITGTAVGAVPSAVLAPGGIATFDDGRVENYAADGDLQRLIGAAGSRIRRLAAFVAIE